MSGEEASSRHDIRICLLVYDSRSGSTVLSAFLDRFTGVAVMPENRLLGYLFTGPATYNDLSSLATLFDVLRSDWQIPEVLGLDSVEAKLAAALTHSGPLPRDEVFFELIASWTRSADATAELVVVKTGISQAVMIAIDSIPDLSVMSVVRDGRGVFASKRRSRSVGRSRAMQTSAPLAARTWARKYRLISKLSGKVQIRYEDFVADGESVAAAALAQIGRRTGMPSLEKPSINDGESRFAQRIGGSQRHLHGLVGGPLVVGRTDAWKSELTAAQIFVYELFAGFELREAGYPLLGRRPLGWVDVAGVALELAMLPASWLSHAGSILLNGVTNTSDLLLKVRLRTATLRAAAGTK